jgi:hypothetical protein
VPRREAAKSKTGENIADTPDLRCQGIAIIRFERKPRQAKKRGPQEDVTMSIAALSANSFYQNPTQDLLSAPERTQDRFTLPDQAPIPGHARDNNLQDASGAASAPWQGQPAFNVLLGQSGNGLQGQPEFNVLAGQSDTSFLQGQPAFNVLNYSLPEL